MKSIIILLLFYMSANVIFAQDSLSTTAYNPCNDKQLLRLQEKDSLTTDETLLYVELRKLCKEYNTSIATQSQDEIADSSLYYYSILALLIGGGIAWLFFHK